MHFGQRRYFAMKGKRETLRYLVAKSVPDPIVAGKSESKSFAELKGSLSEYVLENALARLNERPNDVVAHLMVSILLILFYFYPLDPFFLYEIM